MAVRVLLGVPREDEEVGAENVNGYGYECSMGCTWRIIENPVGLQEYCLRLLTDPS